MSFTIGVAAWFVWRINALQYNHVTFKSEKTEFWPRIKRFYHSNRTLLDPIIAGIVLMVLTWIIGKIHIL
jgi:hypothetical protein